MQTPKTHIFNDLYIDSFATTKFGVNNNSFTQLDITSADLNGTLKININSNIQFGSNETTRNLPIILCDSMTNWFDHIEIDDDTFAINFKELLTYQPITDVSNNIYLKLSKVDTANLDSSRVNNLLDTSEFVDNQYFISGRNNKRIGYVFSETTEQEVNVLFSNAKANWSFSRSIPGLKYDNNSIKWKMPENMTSGFYDVSASVKGVSSEPIYIYFAKKEAHDEVFKSEAVNKVKNLDQTKDLKEIILEDGNSNNTKLVVIKRPKSSIDNIKNNTHIVTRNGERYRIIDDNVYDVAVLAEGDGTKYTLKFKFERTPSPGTEYRLVHGNDSYDQWSLLAKPIGFNEDNMIAGETFSFSPFVIVSASLASSSSTYGSTIGDPYIITLDKQIYKLPSNNHCYRYISLDNQKFVLNIKTDFLSQSMLQEAQKYFGKHFDVNATFISLAFLYHNNKQIIIDVERFECYTKCSKHEDINQCLKCKCLKRYIPDYSRLDCNKKSIVESKLQSIYGKEKYISWTWYLDQATIIFYRYASPQIRTGIDIMIKDSVKIDDGIIAIPCSKTMHVKKLCDTQKIVRYNTNIKQRKIAEMFVTDGNETCLDIWKL